MRPVTARALDAPACALGESPRWAHDAWWWVDAERGVVWTAPARLTAGAGTGERAARALLRTGGRTSLVQPATGGRVVVAAGIELVLVDAATGTARPWARIDLPPGWVLNDGTADHSGRLWVGSVHPTRRPGTGRLHMVDRDGTVRHHPVGTALSNGMVWRDPGTLLHVDSAARCLWERHVDGPECHARDHAPLLRTARAVPVPDLDLPASPAALPGVALPDGVALDVDGGVWVAVYGTARAVRLVDGRVAAVVEVPTAQVTAVALGGPDGRDLLLTTAQEGMDAAARAADPWAGRLFHARVDVPAAPVLLLGVRNNLATWK